MEKKKRQVEDGRKEGRREGRKEGRKEERKRKKNQQLLYVVRDFHFISDFKDGSSNHLVLRYAELKGI